MPTLALETIRTYLDHCDPGSPIITAEDQQKWYVPLDKSGRGDRSPTEELRKRILFSSKGKSTCHLFTGFSGSGKTTELYRFKREIEQPGNGYRVILVDFIQYIDPYTPVTITDILRVVAYTLDREADLVEGKDPDQAPGYLKRFWQFLQSDAELKGVQYELYGSRLMYEIRDNPTFRQKVDAALRLRFQRFAQEAHESMAASVVRIQQKTMNEVIFIADGLEKLQPASASDQGSVETSVEAVFRQHARLLRIPSAHAVYTFPEWLRFRCNDLGTIYDGAPLALPMVKLCEEDGQENPEGVASLIELVGRRVDLGTVFGGKGAPALLELVKASGGFPKDLLRLVRDLIRDNGFSNFPAPPSAAGRVTRELSEEYRMSLRDGDLETLADVYKTRALPTNEAKLITFGRLLDRWIVLAYRNGHEWYGIHPLIQRLPLVTDFLKQRAAAVAPPSTE